jgi:predicted AlkP superfamily phosphohydrolase/phosphomutase
MKKVMVLGWDGVPPRIVFDSLRDDLPNLNALLKTSIYGPLRSTTPPITIPAWMSMTTGCDPGQLGLYGFRHRAPGNYKHEWIPDSTKVRTPKIWDLVGEKNGKVVVIGVPPTYPPPKVNGLLVSGFLAPDTNHPYTYPKSFANTISNVVGEYLLDVFYRTNEKEELLSSLFEMVKKRHKLAKYIIKNEEWNLFFLMEIGSDRLHHGFWKYYDKSHLGYEKNNTYESRFVEFYKLLDQQLGEILELISPDTLFILVSDHGAKSRHGVFCINQWLQKNGYLSLKKKATHPLPFKKLEVDWGSTRAWAWGGYYARIFINVEGYEESGTIPPEQYDDFRDELAQALIKITGPNGVSWENIVVKPEEVYIECKGDYPDLMVYFDDLNWRVSSAMGHESMYFYDDNSGPDDAVHDWNGIHVVKYPGEKLGIKMSHNILDIAPTILRFMNIKIPNYMSGQVIGSY